MPSKKHRPTKDEREHKGRVAQMSCIVSGMRPVEVHHKTGAGMGLRASDWEVMPLTKYRHTAGPYGECVHRGTRTFEEKFGTQEELITKTYHRLALQYPELYGENGRLRHHVPSYVYE